MSKISLLHSTGTQTQSRFVSRDLRGRQICFSLDDPAESPFSLTPTAHPISVTIDRVTENALAHFIREVVQPTVDPHVESLAAVTAESIENLTAWAVAWALKRHLKGPLYQIMRSLKGTRYCCVPKPRYTLLQSFPLSLTEPSLSS